MPILTQPVRGRKEWIPLSEELIQRNLIEAPEKMGDWNFYNIGATTLKALKGAKIIPDKDYEAYEVKKPDALIVKKPIIIAAIEYKTPQELRTEKQIAKAIAQEIGTAQILQAKVYVVTDGKKTFWINPATGQVSDSKLSFPPAANFPQIKFGSASMLSLSTCCILRHVFICHLDQIHIFPYSLIV